MKEQQSALVGQGLAERLYHSYDPQPSLSGMNRGVPLNNNRILVVDDNEGVHQDFRKILMPALPRCQDLNELEETLFGTQVSAPDPSQIIYCMSYAPQAAQGLLVFEAALKQGEPFSVVFTDVRMPPGEDGIGLIEKIWKLAPETQVVIMTAFSDYSWEDMIRRFGWSDRLLILRKPFDTITIKQLALMLSQRWTTERTLRIQHDELKNIVKQKERTDLKLAHFREVLDQAGDAILMANPSHGAILEFNSTLAGMLGYTPVELVQLTLDDILARGNFRTWTQPQTVDVTFRHKNGELVPAEVSLTLKQVEGQTYLLAMARDTRERIEQERERLRLEAQLRHAQKMQTIGTLASGIAHDFNNILSPILVYTEMAIEDTTSERTRGDLEQVAKAAMRARELVQHILNFSHQVEKDRTPLKLDLIIKEALHLIRATLPSTIRISTDIRDCGLVVAGPSQIHQVLMNLCTNARHAMRQSGGELKISLRNISEKGIPQSVLIAPGSYCLLEVSDSGTGIPEELIPRIFEPFFTTKEKGEGTGLGLSMVFDIVRAHEGAIDVVSKPGEGSTFRIFLPKIEEPEPRAKPMLHPPQGGKQHILFVDDEEMLARMMTELLSRFGYQVTTVTDSREALRLFKEAPNRYDVIITDQTMPYIEGTELAKEVLKIRPNIPLILCTGFGESVSQSLCEDIGIGTYLLKPVTVRDLITAIEQTAKPEP